MLTNQVFSILDDWNLWNHALLEGHLRPFYLDRLEKLTRTNQIVVITGPRRVGKSFLMRQWMTRLLQNNFSSSNILMVNLEDPRFEKLDTKLLDTVWQGYQSHLKPTSKPFLLLDEIQEVHQWEKWVRVFHELDKAKIILSGSNANLLGKELATLLTGRHVKMTVLPFSFAELAGLRFPGEAGNTTDYLHLLDEMLASGGFPEVWFSEAKRELLLQYFDDLIHKDLIRRYKIRKGETLKKMAVFYAAHCGSPITFNALEKFLSMSADTAERFSEYLEDAYLFFFLKRFSFKPKEREKSPRKIYCIDTGLASAVSGRNIGQGHLAENILFLHLLGQKLADPLLDFFYWKNEQHREVDFVVTLSGKPNLAIQVCWDSSHHETRQREIKSLVSGLTALKLSEGIILTREEEGQEKIGVHLIRTIPLWKWLLGKQPKIAKAV